MKLKISILSAILLLPAVLSAQWGNDPMQNNAIADTVNEQITPKMVATMDGGSYVSWFDSRNGNYAVYLQKINDAGFPLWTPKGLLISDHPQYSWITDYDLAVDDNDNAVLVFNDARNGATADLDIFAYKIASDGTFLWGPDGICLSAAGNTFFEATAKVTATSAGNFVFTWNKSGAAETIQFQKLAADGAKLWGPDGFEISGAAGHNLSFPDLVAAEDDSVIALWKDYTGPFYAPVTKLYCQKFAPDGSAAWDPLGVMIYSLGKMPGYEIPQIYSDENGGAFFCYFDAPSLAEFRVWAQHVGADGNLIFPMNGVSAATNTQRLHLNPTLGYNEVSDELFLFWEEKNTNQNQYGIYGQKFAPDGSRLWGDDGKQFVGLGSLPISFTQCALSFSAQGIFLGYLESPSETSVNTAVKSMFVDFSGGILWNEKILSDASLGNKGSLVVRENRYQQAVMVWKDERADNGDIYGQNINLDGTLGDPPVQIPQTRAQAISSFTLHQNYPNPFNPNTTISFQLHKAAATELAVYNLAGQKVRTLLNGVVQAGVHRAGWNGVSESGKTMSSGYYYFRLSVNGESISRKMLLMK